MPYDMMKSGRFETQTYYQVLIDQRDLPTIVSQSKCVCIVTLIKSCLLQLQQLGQRNLINSFVSSPACF